MTQPFVAIIAPAGDGHLPPVCAELRKRGVPVLRFHLADFPQKAMLTARCYPQHTWESVLVYEGQSYPLSALTGIWNRRRAPNKASPLVPDYARQFVQDEARHALDGVWKSLDQVCWVNHPDANRAADSKPYQLHIARQCGLSIPASLITNDPDELRRFFAECDGQVIYKALNRNLFRTPDGLRYLFTSQVCAEDLEQAPMRDGIRATAHLFQRLIPKRLELRILIVGATIFAAEIYSQQTKHGQIDFRKSYDDLRYGVHTLPGTLQKQLLQLMRLLHLEYAAIDMILQPDGTYVFLEANCSGQYGWIEDETHLPISKTLVDLLLHEAPRVTDELGKVPEETVYRGD